MNSPQESRMICYRVFIKVKDTSNNEEDIKVFDVKVADEKKISPVEVENFVCDYIEDNYLWLKIIDRSGYKIISSDEYGLTYTIPYNPNKR